MPDKPWGEILIAIQNEIDVPKNKENTFGGYFYRSAEDIWLAAKPLFAKYGLLVCASDRVEARNNYNYQVCTISVYVGRDLTKIAEAEGWAREDDSKKKFDSPQLSGSASSYAAKRAWGNLLGLDDEKDSDATNKHNGNGESTLVKSTPTPTPPPTIEMITPAQIKGIHAIMTDTGVIRIKDLFKGFLQNTGKLSGDSITDLTKEQAGYIISNFNQLLVSMYANNTMHVNILTACEKIANIEHKRTFISNMSTHVEGASDPDLSETVDKSLNDYCKLFLTQIHNQESNRVVADGEAKGLTPEQVMNKLNELKMQPREVKQYNLTPDKKEGKTGATNEPDTSYI